FVGRWGLPLDMPPTDAPLAAAASAPGADRDAGAKLLDQHVLDRWVAVLTTTDFKYTAAAKDFSLHSVDRVYYKEIIHALGDVVKAVESEHAELAELVRAEFAETRRALAAGFDQLVRVVKAEGEQIQAAVKDGLARVGQKLDGLHADLTGVQAEL